MKEKPNLPTLVTLEGQGGPAGVPTSPRLIQREESRHHARQAKLLNELGQDDLATFTPKMLQKHLLERRAPDLAYHTEPTHAAVLYFDIVGFTSIMDKFVRLDNGAERMSYHLNYTFRVILEEIQKYHGDTLQFSGDAVMAAWIIENPSDKQALKNVVTLAAQCGESVVSAVGKRTIEVGEESVDLMLHVGLACAPMTMLIVGGIKRHWKFVCIGPAISAAATASVLAQADQIVVTQETIDCSKPSLSGNSIPNHPGYALLVKAAKKTPPSPYLQPNMLPPIGSMNSFLSSAVTGLLYEMKQGESPRSISSPSRQIKETPLTAGEVRTVSSLFIKLIVDVTTDDLDSVHSAYMTIQRKLTKTGGTSNKLIYDDKGLICLCVFGLPGMSHEDDAARSITFAKSTLARLSDKDIVACIGISRSRAYCGICGCDSRREYTVLGDGVNLAARLMGQAEELVNTGELCIVVDESTKESCAGVHEFTEASKVNVKGKEQLVKVYKVVDTPLTHRSKNSSNDKVPCTIRASPSLRRSESFLSSSSSSSIFSTRSLSEHFPGSPCTVVSGGAASVRSASSGITVITPLARSLRNMARVSAALSSSSANSVPESLGSIQHLFPCTTNQGSLVVIGRIEEMKSFAHCIDKLAEGEQIARFSRTVKRKMRRTITPAVTDPDSAGSGDEGAAADYITLEEEGNGRNFSRMTPRGLASKKSFASVAQSVGTTVDLNGDREPTVVTTPVDASLPVAKAEEPTEQKAEEQMTPPPNAPPTPPPPPPPPPDAGQMTENIENVCSSPLTSVPSSPPEQPAEASYDEPLPLPLALTKHGSQTAVPTPQVPRSPESEPSRLKRKPTVTTINTVDTSRTRFILLEGEVGIGKSILLHKAADMARDKRVISHMLTGAMVMRKRPYGVFSKLLDEIVSDRGIETLFQAPVTAQQGAVLKYLCPGLEMEIPEGDAMEGGSRQRMQAVNELIKAMLSRYSRGHGYLLVIDDVQWLDDLSWSVLMYLAEHEPVVSMVMSKRIRGVVVAGNIMAEDEQNNEKFHQGLLQSASRSRLPSLDDELDMSMRSESTGTHSTDGEHDELEELAKGSIFKMEFLSEYRTYGGGCVFQLTPLNRDMSSMFYKMVLSVKSIEASVFNYAFERSSGNPGVAERLFVALNERKALVVLGDRVVEFTPSVHPSDFEHIVPSDVEAMFVSVTDKLPHDQQYHLKIMAVLGLSFSLPLFSSVASLTQDKAKDRCDSLVSSAILVQSTSQAEDRFYSFRVPLLRDCVYQKMLMNQKKDMHLKVVCALENSARCDPVVLARHLVKAEDDRAVAFLSTAASKELWNNNYQSATGLIKQLLDCSKQGPSWVTIKWTRKLHICCLHIGKHNEATKLLERLGKLLNEQVPKPTRTALWKAHMRMSFAPTFSCCFGTVPATTSDKTLLLERILFTYYKVSDMLFGQDTGGLELVCLRGLRYLELYKKCCTTTRQAGSSSALISAPEEAWADTHDEEEDTQDLDKVRPALLAALRYLDYSKGHIAKQDPSEKHSVYKQGLLQPFAGESTASLFCTASNVEDVNHSIRTLRHIQSSAEGRSCTYTVHLSLALQAVLEALRGQIGDALIVAGELRESCKSEATRDTRFGLYSLALGCIVLYSHIDAPSSLQEPRERIENVLLFAESHKTRITDNVLLALLGSSLALGLSREEDSDRALGVVRTYNIISLVSQVALFTPFHFLIVPALLEVLVRAYVVRSSKDFETILIILDIYTEMAAKFPVSRGGLYYWKGEVLKAKGDIQGAITTWMEGIGISEVSKMPYDGALCKAGLALLSGTNESERVVYLQEAAEVFAMCKTNDCLPL